MIKIIKKQKWFIYLQTLVEYTNSIWSILVLTLSPFLEYFWHVIRNWRHCSYLSSQSVYIYLGRDRSKCLVSCKWMHVPYFATINAYLLFFFIGHGACWKMKVACQNRRENLNLENACFNFCWFEGPWPWVIYFKKLYPLIINTKSHSLWP